MCGQRLGARHGLRCELQIESLFANAQIVIEHRHRAEKERHPKRHGREGRDEDGDSAGALIRRGDERNEEDDEDEEDQEQDDEEEDQADDAPAEDEEDEKTAHELEEGGIREERDRIVGRLLRNPHEGRSAGERENDAEDDPRDDEGNKEDQAQDEEADRACTIDREDAVEDVPYTERS